MTLHKPYTVCTREQDQCAAVQLTGLEQLLTFLLIGAEEDGEDGLPQSVEVTDDALALRIPLGPDDSDNYVIGAPWTTIFPDCSSARPSL